MATFILVHGVWHWGGCWQEVRKPLEAAGHVVETPTLLGMGETAFVLNSRPRPKIGVMAHIRQVTEVVRQVQNPAGVILVAHSYAGLVASGVVEALTKQGAQSRIRHLVFLDAMVPRDAQRDFNKRVEKQRCISGESGSFCDILMSVESRAPTPPEDRALLTPAEAVAERAGHHDDRSADEYGYAFLAL